MGKFLYGHVAKEGETPTHTIAGVDYVGAILPALPEKTSDNISLRVVRRVVRDTALFKFDGYYHTFIYAGCTCSVDSNGNLVITANGVGSNTSYPGKMQPVSDTLRSGAVEWSVGNSGSWVGTYSFPLDELIWTADTIYDTSTGELIMSASDPIPVGSAPEVEPKAFMLGYLTGQKARQLRRKLTNTEDIIGTDFTITGQLDVTYSHDESKALLGDRSVFGEQYGAGTFIVSEVCAMTYRDGHLIVEGDLYDYDTAESSETTKSESE